MIKTLTITGLFLILTSCNSNEKKTTDALKTQEPLQLEMSITRGKIIYSDMCITCHMANGKGIPRAFPPLADSDYLREYQTESIKAVKRGMSGEIVVNGLSYNSVMSPLGLSDDEVADVMNYINNSWNNTIDNFVTTEKVSKL
jgi:mono/diheme cytochrome c family protein